MKQAYDKLYNKIKEAYITFKDRKIISNNTRITETGVHELPGTIDLVIEKAFDPASMHLYAQNPTVVLQEVSKRNIYFSHPFPVYTPDPSLQK